MELANNVLDFLNWLALYFGFLARSLADIFASILGLVGQ